MNTTDMFSGIMGKIRGGCLRLSMGGKIAVKTSGGYRTYDPKTGRVTNCSNFVMDIADDMFMTIPTRKIKEGDIIFFNGRPVYVLSVESKNRIEVMDYETTTIQKIIPEHHTFLGRKFYGKVVSLFGGLKNTKGGFFKSMMKMKMMSSLMGGSSDGGDSMSKVLPFMMLGDSSFGELFDGIVDDDSDDDSDEEDVGFDDIFGEDDDSENEKETK